MNKFYLLLAIFFLWFFFFKNDSVTLGPGVLAPNPPKQLNNITSQKFQFKDYTITPLAKFHINAKVLSKTNYSWDKESDLSPIDLALGWGKMSDEKVLDSLTITQSNRWYHWSTDKFIIPRKEIETHSANMHLIPANSLIESAMNRTRQGDIIELNGYLIRASNKEGWHWESSLSRTDTGAHACELIWVENFEIQKP